MFVLFATACAVWVYLDATANKIGKTSVGGLFNMPAGAWGVVCLGIWIVGFPAYLIKRNALKAIAVEHPVEPKARVLKACLLAATGIVWLVVASYMQYLQKFQ